MMMAFISTRKSCPPQAQSTRIKPFFGAWLLLLTTLLLSGNSYSFEIKPYQLDYQVTTKGFHLQTSRELKPVDNQWQLTQTSENMFLTLTEKSLFSVDEKNHISSNRYSYQRKVIGHSKRYELTFDNTNQQALYYRKDSDKKYIDYELPVYDALNYQFYMRQYLSEHEGRFSQQGIPVIERDRLREFRFNVIGEELLETKAGLLHTLKLQRIRSKKSKQTYIWLAKDWDYTVVKMLHTEEDEAPTTLLLTNGKIDGKAIHGIEAPPGRLK